MLEYVDFVFDHINEMPEPTKDIERISTLHSWYKHLGKFVKAYPLLRQGEEVRYSFSPDLTDENPQNFHWTIVMDYNLDDYGIKLDNSDKFYKIPDTLKDFMKCFPIYLDHDFGDNSSEKGKFLLMQCEMLCREYWKELVNMKKLVNDVREKNKNDEETTIVI